MLVQMHMTHIRQPPPRSSFAAGRGCDILGYHMINVALLESNLCCSGVNAAEAVWTSSSDMIGQAHHAGTRIVEMMTEDLTPRSILKHASFRRSTEVPTSARLRPTRRCFVDQILFNSRMEKLAGYFDGDYCIQHTSRSAMASSILAPHLRPWPSKA
ncbi:hypothetical protein [Cupriavidus sp. D39]|uniref:hypothetical protein n=1 Tax=Cupriavidus sp. D39 TaxID=2997877 RepID=UPI002271D30D|nr:hypothetical protein [Cupriavidus sp. D39]MCY0852596.1 hypothetical protein [Cupriavidus sp. D39]